MSLRRMSAPSPKLAADGSVRGEAAKLAEQKRLSAKFSAMTAELQRRETAPRGSRVAPAPTEGSRLGLPSLDLGNASRVNPHFFVTSGDRGASAADAQTQETAASQEQNAAADEADVDQDPARDGWEQSILDAQQRQAEAAAAEAAAEAEAAAAAEAEAAAEATREADDARDDALVAFEGEFDEFSNEWAEEHDGVSIDEDGTLLLPSDQFDALAAEWEADYQSWLDGQAQDLVALDALEADYCEAVAHELRLAALEAGRLGEDADQAIQDKADEIRERDTNWHQNADGSWHADGQDERLAELIAAVEEQVLGESPAVREAWVDYAEESQTLESAEALPDNLSDKTDTVDAAQAEVDAAAAARDAAVAEQMEDLERSVLEELADQLGVTAVDVYDHTAGMNLPQTLADLSDEQLLGLVQDALGESQAVREVQVDYAEQDLENALDALESAQSLPDNLSDKPETVTAAEAEFEEAQAEFDEAVAALDTAVGHHTASIVLPQTLADLSDEQLAETTLGVEDEQAAIDALADELIGMAAGEVSDAHGNNSYVDDLLFGDDYSPGAVDQIAVDLRAGELGSIIEEIDPGELSGVEKEQWDAGDQATVALQRRLEVSFGEGQAIVNGKQVTLGEHEQRLLATDPMALALLLKSGFRIEGVDDLGSFTITLNGDEYDTAALTQGGLFSQEELAALMTQAQKDEASLAAFASLLWHSNPQALNDSDRSWVAAHDAFIVASVRDQMEATDDVQERWRLYNAHRGATLTSSDLLWQETNELLDWDDVVAGIVNDESNVDDLGGALADMLMGYGDLASMPSEHADAIVQALIDNVDLNKLHDQQGTDELYKVVNILVAAASVPVEQLPADSVPVAQRVADWWTAPLEQRDGGSPGHLWNPDTGYEFLPTTLESTVRDGALWNGSEYVCPLAENVAGILDEISGDTGDTPFSASYGDAISAYTDVLENAPPPPSAALENYNDFMSRRDELVPNYFDRIMADNPDLGEAQEVVYGDELRDLIAAGMNLDWRNNDVDKKTVDFIMDEMFIEAGVDEDERETTAITVTVVPYIYAAERDGWTTGALFDVDGPDEDIERTLNGGGRSYTVTEIDPHEFVIDGGVMANLASQAAFKGVEVDAITKDQPWLFDSVKHFQDKNYLSEKGLLYLPNELGEQYGLEMELFGPSANGDVRVGMTAAAIETTGEKALAAVDIGLTFASLGAMLLPGGLALAGLAKAASAALWAARGTLLGSTIYSAARGAYELNELRGLGMDIGWSNRMARSIYVEWMGTAAGIGAMAGGRLTRELLDASGPGRVTRAARAAYLSTQAGNAVDLGTGAWLSLDGLRQLAFAGDDASARDWLMAVMGPAMLSLGGVGMVQESNHYHAHRSGDYLQDAIDGEAADLAGTAAKDAQKPQVQRPVDTSSPDYRPTALRARLPRAAEDAYTPTPEHKEPTILFRGATRGPDEIFVEGFTADGQPWTSGMISTSLSASDAKSPAKGADEDGRPDGRGGWLYTIMADVSDGDIVASLPVNGRYSGGDHYEFRFGEAIPPERILAARRVSPDGRLVGEPVYNPDFADPDRLPDAFREVDGAATKEGCAPPPLSLKTAALFALGAQLGLGNLGPFNIMSSADAGLFQSTVSAHSKLGWLRHNHSWIDDVFKLAAMGEKKSWSQWGRKKSLEDVLETRIKHSKWWGAAKLNDEEADAARDRVREVAVVGENYRQAREALPKLREALPEIDIRKWPAPDGIVYGWLPDHLQDVPEIDALMTAMREDKAGEYYGLDSQAILRKLSVKLGGLASDELGNGLLAKRLSDTRQARENYRTLYELMREALPGKGRHEPAATPTLPHYLQSLLKLHGDKKGKGITGVLDLAARGKIERAVNRLDKILDTGPRLTEAETEDVWSMVLLVAEAGADYRDAFRDVPSDLRKLMPRMIAIRGDQRPASAEIVQGWLEEPEFANAINAMAKDEAGEYYNKDRQAILEDLSEKLDGLTLDELQDGGILADRLAATWDAREAYRTFHQILREASPARAEGKEIDHKAAEKYPGSSLVPATWLGYGSKTLSFAAPVNMFLASFVKPFGSLSHLSDLVRALPTTVAKGIYMAILRDIVQFKKDYPFPRSPEKEEEFQKLDAKRKKFNTIGDYMSLASAASNIMLGTYFLLRGNILMAGLLYSQAASSIAWVMVQQDPHLKIGEKLRLHSDLMEKLEIDPRAKPLIRWISIILGVGVPTAVVIQDNLSDEEDSKTRSTLDRIYEAMEALDGDGHAPVWPAAVPARSGGPPELSDLPAPPLATPGFPVPTNPSAPQQLVVTAGGGLNLRTRPSADSAIITVLQPGSLIDETGKRMTDKTGNVWVPVSGYGPDGRPADGWVSGDFVEMHPKGGQDENGRINPELDQLGYRWVEAKDGDSIRLIANSHSADVAETVMLNMDHIFIPALIYPGDRIYLPGPDPDTASENPGSLLSENQQSPLQTSPPRRAASMPTPSTPPALPSRVSTGAPRPLVSTPGF